jgi:tetratricopeptide (TPR) repeat protein
VTALLTTSSTRYEVVRRLGVGGMAEVFLARDRDGRPVAIKRLLAGDDVDRLDLFLDEAKIAARFRHPNIVQVHELGCDGEGLYLVLEYVSGRTLSAALRRGGERPWPRHLAAHVVAEIACALDHVHRATGDDGAPLEIVHRDVSPQNVLVSLDGDVKLTDFGIAKARDALHRTRTGLVRGTVGYVSPEQVRRGKVGAASDVWSAGVILWEASLGGRLFGGDDAVERIVAGDVLPPTGVDPDYPPDLEALVMAALDPEPDRRPSAGELERGLRAVATRLGAGAAACRAELRATMRGWFAEVETPSPRRRAIGLASVAAAAFSLLGGDLPRSPRRDDPARDEAWRMAQGGAHEPARILVDDLVAARPEDPDLAVLSVLVHWWLGSRLLEAQLERAEALRLSPARRALVGAIRLIYRGRAAEAVAATRAAEMRHPGSAEIAYGLGEALWHAGDRDEAVTWLRRAVERDPSWRMALEHAVDLWAARGDADAIRGVASEVARVDASAARGLKVAALIAERRYADASVLARVATALDPHDAALWNQRAGAEVLAGDLDTAAASAATALVFWPLDDRERGPRTLLAGLHLYAGDEAAYLDAIGPRFEVANVLRQAIWHGIADPSVPSPVRADRAPLRLGDAGMASPPLFECATVLGADLRGGDISDYWAPSPYPEVRGLGAALADERAGDLVGAAARLEEAVDAAIAETRPLIAFELARVRAALGDDTGAAAACDDVLRPRAPVAYRAVLLPDCDRWTR